MLHNDSATVTEPYQVGLGSMFYAVPFKQIHKERLEDANDFITKVIVVVVCHL